MPSLNFNTNDTIYALSTPPGTSAIAVIRVSGANALNVNGKIFKPKRTHQKHFVSTLGNVLEIDESVCITYPFGKSYTGEECFELFIHGNMTIVDSVFNLLEDHGCRLAEPGEFTMRAFLNGKMDLCSAEAVNDIICSKSKEASMIALRNLNGGLSELISSTRSEIVSALSEIESRLDFPEDISYDCDFGKIINSLNQTVLKLKKLIETSKTGRSLLEGARVVLFGKPNVGKSTLVNSLIGENRSIVHDLPGTTRDIIEIEWFLDGVLVTLVDVAGIRNLNECCEVEAIGVKFALKELKKADIVLFLIDESMGSDIEPELEDLSSNVLKIRTKADLIKDLELVDLKNGDFFAMVSAKTGLGLDSLKKKLKKVILGEHVGNENIVFLTKLRHINEVKLAVSSILKAEEIFSARGAVEIAAFELRQAGLALDRIMGLNINEDVLNLIFKDFCIGK